MRTISTPIFTFSELSESAKQKAMQWFRESDCDNFWSESVIDDAKTIGQIIGLDIEKIYYSGFSSQGDGACFEGSYRYKKGALKALKSYAPLDTKLHAICKGLQDVQKMYFYKLHVSMKHRGYYYHERCMLVDVTHSDDEYRDIRESENAVTELMRDFAKWIYRQLETEYDYQNSDDVVRENILTSEYEFLESGVVA